MTHILLYSLAETERHRRVGIALQKLLRRPFEAHEAWRVDAIRKVSPHRSDGRAIPHTKAHRVHRVIEVLEVALVKTEGHIAQRTEDVTHVVEEDTLYVFPDQGEPQLDVVKEERISPERKTCRLRSRTVRDKRRSHIARTRLIDD